MDTIITLPKKELNAVSLPGMGRSIELSGLKAEEHATLKNAYSQSTLQVEFEEEIGTYHQVINIWPDPHTTEKLTLFIK